MAAKAFSTTTPRVVTTALVTALATLGLGVPAATATQQAEHLAQQAEHRAQEDRGPRSALQKQVDAVGRTGTVGVLARSTGPHGDRTATAGVADARTGREARSDDRFRIASLTKTYVSTVLLQLAGEGELSLDDTVDDWLPGVVSGNGNDGAKITVRQLLNQTSGLFDYTADLPLLGSAEEWAANRFTTWTDEQLVGIAMRHAPHFTPGDDWSYSNTNYVVAGMIIKKVTGRTWQREVTARVIRPLDLHDTLALTTSPRIPGSHLKGYSAFGGSAPAIDTTAVNPSSAGASGAMISTTGDLAAFHRALMGGKLLKPAQLKEMTTTVRAAELDQAWEGARYGLGLAELPLSCGGSFYGHAGGTAGYASRTGVSPDGRRVVVLAATGDGTMPDTLRATNALMDEQLCAGRSQ